MRKGTFRTGMNTHKWGIRVFCLLANRRGLASSCTILKEQVSESREAGSCSLPHRPQFTQLLRESFMILTASKHLLGADFRIIAAVSVRLMTRARLQNTYY